MWGETNFANAFGELKRSKQANVAEILTRSTSGAHVSFTRQKAVEEAVIDIGEELHGQYLLSFTPRAPAASGFHSIHVMSRNRPDLNIRSRAGYWTGPPE